MPLDLGVLAQRLDEYATALEEHSRFVTDYLDDASAAYARVDRAYTGGPIDLFKAEWEHTQSQLRDYIGRTLRLRQLVVDKLDLVRRQLARSAV